MIMPRLGVDKQAATAVASKKHVDNRCMYWFRQWGASLEKIQSSSTAAKIVRGGIFFHPSDEDLSMGTPAEEKATRAHRVPCHQL